MDRKKVSVIIGSSAIVVAIAVVGASLSSSGNKSESEGLLASPETSSPSTTPVVPTTSPRFIAGNEVLCGVNDQLAFMQEITGLDDIPMPQMDPLETKYMTETVDILLRPCEQMGVLVHEVAHYIMDRYHRFDFDAHLADVQDTFCPGGPVDGRCAEGWILAMEGNPGIEHSAHCLGHALLGPSAYTLCPFPTLRDAARQRIEGARTLPATRQ